MDFYEIVRTLRSDDQNQIIAIHPGSTSKRMCRIIFPKWINADESIPAKMRVNDLVGEQRVFASVKFGRSITKFPSFVTRLKSRENIISSPEKKSEQPYLIT